MALIHICELTILSSAFFTFFDLRICQICSKIYKFVTLCVNLHALKDIAPISIFYLMKPGHHQMPVVHIYQFIDKSNISYASTETEKKKWSSGGSYIDVAVVVVVECLNDSTDLFDCLQT